jgi:hypothetical protein
MKRTSVNQEELLVVEHLADRLANWLGDRDGFRHPPPWEPRQHVVLGVLPAQILAPPPAATDADRDENAEAEVAGQSIESSVRELLSADDTALPAMTLTFRVVGAKECISIAVDLDFALYVEEYATLNEQLEYVRHGIAEGPGAEPTGGLAGSQALEEPAAGAAASDTHAGAGGGRPAEGRKRQTSVGGAWRRLSLHVNGVVLNVPTTEEHVTVSDTIAHCIHSALDEHFAQPDAARPFTTRTRTIQIQDLVDEQRYRQALKEKEDSAFAPQYPTLQLTAFAQPLAGSYLVSLSLTNATLVPKRPFQDLSVYDCRMKLRPLTPATIENQRFELTPRDYRYMDDVSLVWGQGSACVAELLPSGELASTTLPRFYQPEVVPRTDHVPAPRWDELAADPDPILDSIETAMCNYLEEWNNFLRATTDDVRLESRRERNAFVSEIERFRVGRKAMRVDSRLAQAFRAANAVFADANAAKGYHQWHLFQIVYVVSQLPALAAREHRHDPDFVRELDFADVLWIPTGGGKTEAYLGLLVVALFYDRLRGKERGVTAWLKFPLRMLSVQQLARVLRVLVAAERYRTGQLNACGAPFELGYLIGSSNTPNRLRYSAGEWWHGFDAAKDTPTGFFDERRLVAECPYCGENKIGLDVDVASIRLKHVCRECGQTLPIYMSDEEIYRYMPSVLVGTVDKLTGFAFFGEFTQFTHGPRWSCPKHGGFSFREGGKCLVGEACSITSTEYVRQVPWHDPVPALIIQDEMHLLREELGVFDAHYEGLLVELQRSSLSAMPSKILAASATIEQYEDQLRQIYGRRPRSFPVPGFERTRGFYLAEKPNTRRLYIGVLPHYRRKADVAAILQTRLLQEVATLQDEGADGASQLRTLGHRVDDVLFNYETSLAYVNSKIHGDQISDEIGRLSDLWGDRGKDRISYRVLTGQVKIADLAEPISRIEQDTLLVPRAQRIRALIGTSVVSHGVDLERLNVLIMAGLPPSVADYIQATSRSGRVHAGLVVTVFDTFSRRERSAFTNFVSFHRFLDRMVEPVPVNKYAYFGADRTLPGIVLALLWDLCRDPRLNGPDEGIRRTRSLQPWWNRSGPMLRPILRQRLIATYRTTIAGLAESTLEDELVERVLNRWDNHELPAMQRFDHDSSTQLFRERVLSSFRDVDEQVDFSALPHTAEAYESLTGMGERIKRSADEVVGGRT